VEKKDKGRNIKNLGLLIILVAVIVFISGCVSDRAYEQPSKSDKDLKDKCNNLNIGYTL